MLHVFSRICLGVIVGLGALRAAAAAPPSAEDVKFFETKVRPLLVERCYGCHGDEKQKGGLRLDSVAAVQKGGKNGPIISPGNPSESKLIRAISYRDKDLQMPPEDEGKLTGEQIATLTRWVAIGAPYPAGGVASASLSPSKKRTITNADRAFWSFQPPRAVELPAAQNPEWNRNPVDRFVV
jgi:hypothetical protein